MMIFLDVLHMYPFIYFSDYFRSQSLSKIYYQTRIKGIFSEIPPYPLKLRIKIFLYLQCSFFISYVDFLFNDQLTLCYSI